MKQLQYPGVRVQQIKDAGTRDAVQQMSGHLRALYDFFNASISTDHGPGLLRQVAPIVIPNITIQPTSQSTYGRVGELVRRGPDVFMKTGIDREDTDWTQLPTGSTGFGVPSGLIGLSPVTGVGTSYLRNDGRHALSQNIQPDWTAPHTHSNYVDYREMAAPATPAANFGRLYVRDNAGTSNLYFKSDAGTEWDLTAFGTVFGSGAANKVARWTSSTTLGTGVLGDDGVNASIVDSGTAIRATFDVSNLSVDQTFGFVDYGAGFGYIVTGSGAADNVMIWGSDDPATGVAFLWVDRTNKQLQIGDGAGGGTPGFKIFGQSSKTMTMTLAGTGIVSLDAPSTGGRFVLSGNTTSPVLTVQGDYESTTGVFRSSDADGGGTAAFTFDATAARTTDPLFTFKNSSGGFNYVTGSAIGEWSFGVGAASQSGNVLAFNVSDTLGTVPLNNWTRGISSSVAHSAAVAPATSMVGTYGFISLGFAAAGTGDAALDVAGAAGVCLCTSDTANQAANTIAGVIGTFKATANTSPFVATTTGTNKIVAGNWKRAASVYGDYFNMGSGATVATNLPAIVCGVYAAIPAPTAGESWGIETDAPTTGKAAGAGNTPAVQGAAKWVFPTRGTRRTHEYYVPNANTGAIRANAAHGDVYFDDGTNFTSGLWEFSKAAAGGAAVWNYLLSSPGIQALGAGIPAVLGTVGAPGPAVAAQATWVQVNCADNVIRWVPAWV